MVRTESVLKTGSFVLTDDLNPETAKNKIKSNTIFGKKAVLITIGWLLQFRISLWKWINCSPLSKIVTFINAKNHLRPPRFYQTLRPGFRNHRRKASLKFV